MQLHAWREDSATQQHRIIQALFRRARAHVATNDINDAILDTKKVFYTCIYA